MYEQVFQFTSRPFTSTPFVNHYFAAESIDQALRQTRVSIDRAAGPVVVFGGAGMGKSMLLAMLEDQYRSQYSVVNLGCARIDARQDLLQSILFELNQPYKGMTETELRFSLMDYLKPSDQCPNGVLLLIDEADSLSVEMLDEIRLITNFVREGRPRVLLVMAGGRRLEENLNNPKLESFNQRVDARCYLNNLSRDETANYIRQHIDQAGGSGETLFDEPSLKAIHEASDGCPRLINQVCEHALILAATNGTQTVDQACVYHAWSDVQSIPGLVPSESQTATTSALSDENWTVIEFGQLEDETEFDDCQPTDCSEESSVENSSEAVNQTETVEQSETTEQSEEENFVGWGSDLADQTENSTEQADTVEQEETAETAQAEADSMAEQLASVFGQTSADEDQGDSETDDEASQESIADLEAQQVELLDQVQSEQDTTANNFDDQESDVENTTAEDSANELLAQDEESEETIDEPVASAMTDELTSEPETSSDETETVASADDSQPEPTTLRVVDDPFAESFEEEEHLRDRFAPFVAHQNQRSLEVTSEDLAHVKPLDEAGAESSAIESLETENDATEVEESISNLENASDETPETSAAFETEPTEIAAVSDEPADSNTETDLSTDETESDENETEAEVSGETAENNLVAETSDETETETETDEQTVSEQTEESKAEKPQFHQHRESDFDEDVEKQAEEILQRLRESRNVSHETEMSESDGNSTGAEQDDSLTDETVTATAAKLDDESEFERQDSALSESQRILEQILDQKRMLAEQQASTDSDSVDAAVSVEYPATDPTQSSEQSNDDKEMLIVNRMEQQTESSQLSTEEPIPFPMTPVSTGRAERMDYQKLFDQLRSDNREESEK